MGALTERELLEQEKRPDDRGVLVHHDYLFHEAIINTTGNKPDTRKIIHQHRTIYEAIRLGETDLAEQAMREHLQTAGLDLLS